MAKQEGERTRLYRVIVTTIPRPTINDPAGLAVRDGLHYLGFEDVESVRIGKYREFRLHATNKKEARRIGQEISKTPDVSNPIMDDIRVEVSFARPSKKSKT